MHFSDCFFHSRREVLFLLDRNVRHANWKLKANLN